jgi:hypothetical protein
MMAPIPGTDRLEQLSASKEHRMTYSSERHSVIKDYISNDALSAHTRRLALEDTSLGLLARQPSFFATVPSSS